MGTILVVVAMIVITVSIVVIALAKKYVVEYKEVQFGALAVIAVALIIMSMTSLTTMMMLLSAALSSLPTFLLIGGLIELWEHVYYKVVFKEDAHEEIALKTLAIGGGIVVAIFWICVTVVLFNFFISQ